jgi:hypothetical protein
MSKFPCSTIGGTNGFEISIQADCTGVPCGVALANGGPEQEVANTTFPACCTANQAVTAHFGAGVALARLVNYWVVVVANGYPNTQDV